MAPKRKITDYAPPPGSKRAKKAEEVPSGDDGFGEHAAVVDGSQQPTKGDLNKLYSAMQYETARHEQKDKHSFWRNYLSDKKFTWLSVQETHTYSKSAKEEHIDGVVEQVPGCS